MPTIANKIINTNVLDKAMPEEEEAIYMGILLDVYEYKLRIIDLTF